MAGNHDVPHCDIPGPAVQDENCVESCSKILPNNTKSRLAEEHLDFLDGWRGIAIICVLFGHFSPFHQLGGIGVTIFFVLSGVLMSRILFVQQMPLTIFYRRRLARIMPVFLLYVTVVFFAGWIVLDEFSSVEFLSTAAFLRTYFPSTDIFKANIPIHHLWSLNVEEHCYLFLSLLSVLVVCKGEGVARAGLTLASLLCVALFIFYKQHPPEAKSLFVLRTEVAAFPLIISCALFLWIRRFPIRVPSFIPIVAFLIAFAINQTSQSVMLSYVAVSLALAISINTLGQSPNWVLKLLESTALRWFGLCSYSIYIWQQPFYFLGRYNSFEHYKGVAVIATLALAACSYYFFEMPMRRWLAGKPAGQIASSPLSE